MIISNNTAYMFILTLILVLIFLSWTAGSQKQRPLLHYLYVALMVDYSIWAIAMLGMWQAPPWDTNLIQLLDAISYLGIAVPAFYLMIAIVFVRGYTRFRHWMLIFLIVPVLAFLVCLTNNMHHLQYVVFSTIRQEIVFGPFVLVTGIHSYICFLASFVLLIRFAIRNPSRLYITQCILLVLGGLIPMVVSIASTLSLVELSIAATPISFLPTLLLNGIAIYRFNLLNITPIAIQHVMNWISDCYMVVSDQGLVVSYNNAFANVFAGQFGIIENRYLKDCLKEEDVNQKTAIFHMIHALEACRTSQATVSYEQAATVTQNGVARKNYYITDVSQLVVNDRVAGFVFIFKDITQLRKSMRQLQDNKNRMMEQERFAFLGQMMGGLAHNLKTPIMSISGCVAAANDLVDECIDSLEDPAVTPQDYREIYGEMRDWFRKIQNSTAYMSDIITAIKGQAASVGAFEESYFTLDELVRRTTLLLRHELMSSGCTLVAEYKGSQHTTLHGDINNLVQVLSNLVTNAVFAQQQVGGGCITLGLEQEGNQVNIFVKDTGPGISPTVRQRLFKEMVTSKGTQGNGLGLYISNTVVQGKFGGSMWCEDNPEGGAIFGMTIPIPQAEADDLTITKPGG